MKENLSIFSWICNHLLQYKRGNEKKNLANPIHTKIAWKLDDMSDFMPKLDVYF